MGERREMLWLGRRCSPMRHGARHHHEAPDHGQSLGEERRGVFHAADIPEALKSMALRDTTGGAGCEVCVGRWSGYQRERDLFPARV
jgi:hypothetical protein